MYRIIMFIPSQLRLNGLCRFTAPSTREPRSEVAPTSQPRLPRCSVRSTLTPASHTYYVRTSRFTGWACRRPPQERGCRDGGRGCTGASSRSRWTRRLRLSSVVLQLIAADARALDVIALRDAVAFGIPRISSRRRPQGVRPSKRSHLEDRASKLQAMSKP
jgi:hypothetical protein